MGQKVRVWLLADGLLGEWARQSEITEENTGAAPNLNYVIDYRLAFPLID